MSRAFYLLFSLVAYSVFLATFLYLIGWVGNLPGLPATIDTGPGGVSSMSIIVDLALIALFGVQHSVMARPGFKAGWTKIVPAPIERSTYMIFTCLALIVMFLFWRPIEGDVWRVDNLVGVNVLWALFAVGWLIVLLSTFLLNHFELFGLQQAFLHLRSREAQAPKFRKPLFYRAVRHPLLSGFFIAFWATPDMSYGHLLFAIGMSAYMLIAIRYEERDLTEAFGPDYERYRQEVGMLTPKLRR